MVSDVETGEANLTYTIVTPPAHGGLAGSGSSRTYTPAADFNGADSFTYEVTDRGDPDNCGAPGPACDAALTSSTATVSITVGAINDAPVNSLPAGPVVALPGIDTPLTGISVSDVDAATDDVKVELSVDHGTLTVNTLVPSGVSALDVVGNGFTLTYSNATAPVPVSPPQTYTFINQHGQDPLVTVTGATADLQVIKTDSPDPVNAGDPLTYGIVVNNLGPNTALGVSVSDTIPAGLTVTSATWTRVSPAGSGSCTGTTTRTCAIGNLNSGSSATVTIVATVAANTADATVIAQHCHSNEHFDRPGFR